MRPLAAGSAWSPSDALAADWDGKKTLIGCFRNVRDMKFPSQNKLHYVSGGAISNDTWSAYGYLNLPKDLSILNHRGYASTDNKGVPWVFRCKVTTYPQDEDGFGLNAVVGSDFATTLKIYVCQNNWVMKTQL